MAAQAPLVIPQQPAFLPANTSFYAFAQAFKVGTFVIPSAPTNAKNTTNKNNFNVNTVSTVQLWALDSTIMTGQWIGALVNSINIPPNTSFSVLDPRLAYHNVFSAVGCDWDHTPISSEAILAYRLSRILFPVLEWILTLLANAHANRAIVPNPNWQNGYRPLYTDSGDTCHCPRPNKKPLSPDRGARSTPIGGSTRACPNWCPGDVKVSNKFSADAHPDLNGPTVMKRWRTWYAQVLAQGKGYSRLCGAADDVPAQQAPQALRTAWPTRTSWKRSSKYSYIVTDKEVVLLKRNENEPRIVHATRGFLLNPTAIEQAANGFVSGMLALVYIHLLAGMGEEALDADQYVV